MKRYNEYMDSVEVSPELHEKLTGLTAPRRPAAWRRYGALAAALVLVVGLGAFGLSRLPGTDAPGLGTAEIGQPEPAIDLAPAGPGDDPGLAGGQSDVSGGYEVIDGKTAVYCLLPYIKYVDEGSSQAADYALAPPSAISRDAAAADAAALVGGRENMIDHLAWDDSLRWGGVVWLLEDGTPCSASLWAEGSDVAFSIELLEGGPVPDCIAYPEGSYETTEFCGVEIRGLKNGSYRVDGGVEMRESRTVSFVTAEGMGCKLTIYGVDGERVEELCARFARWAIVEGFDLSALSAGGDGVPPTAGPDTSVGEPNGEDGAGAPARAPND